MNKLLFFILRGYNDMRVILKCSTVRVPLEKPEKSIAIITVITATARATARMAKKKVLPFFWTKICLKAIFSFVHWTNSCFG